MTLYIFDKDGTICRSKSGREFINSVDDQELIPGVAEKIAQLKAEGHRIAIASNQGGVAFGYLTWAQAAEIVHHAAQLIGADDWLMCPYHTMGTVDEFRAYSTLRKPHPGMLHILAHNAGLELPGPAIMVGDRLEDRQAANRAEIEFIAADEFFGRSE